MRILPGRFDMKLIAISAKAAVAVKFIKRCIIRYPLVV
jgi:hypothetical protein